MAVESHRNLHLLLETVCLLFNEYLYHCKLYFQVKMPRNKGVREKKNPPTAKEKKPDDQFKAAFAQSLKSFLQSKETGLSLFSLSTGNIFTSHRFFPFFWFPLLIFEGQVTKTEGQTIE